MSSKQCLKCGHTAAFEGEPPLACPECGAVYAKVEEALRQQQTIRRQQAASGPASGFGDSELRSTAKRPSVWRSMNEPDVHTFAQRMRDESLYPVWRKIVGICTILGYLVAVCGVVASFIMARESVAGMAIGLAVSVLVAIFAKAGKELSLMVADLSDAAVHLAARAQDR